MTTDDPIVGELLKPPPHDRHLKKRPTTNFREARCEDLSSLNPKMACRAESWNRGGKSGVGVLMRGLQRIGMGLAFTGGLIFIAVLYFSAYWEPDIRWLHFLQSWMYIVSLVLLLRGSKWGCFIGATAALFWDYVNVFVTAFFRNGLEQAHALFQTGHMARPDQLISVPAWFGNLALILGALLVYLAAPRKQWSDMGRLLLALVGTMAFFAKAMVLAQPRYLPLFKGALHPHWRL